MAYIDEEDGLSTNKLIGIFIALLIKRSVDLCVDHRPGDRRGEAGGQHRDHGRHRRAGARADRGASAPARARSGARGAAAAGRAARADQPLAAAADARDDHAAPARTGVPLRVPPPAPRLGPPPPPPSGRRRRRRLPPPPPPPPPPPSQASGRVSGRISQQLGGRGSKTTTPHAPSGEEEEGVVGDEHHGRRRTAVSPSCSVTGSSGIEHARSRRPVAACNVTPATIPALNAAGNPITGNYVSINPLSNSRLGRFNPRTRAP